MLYPPLPPKQFENLPQVFKEIIHWDERDPRKQSVVRLDEAHDYLNKVKDWKHNKANLIAGAQNVVKKQRGGGGAMG